MNRVSNYSNLNRLLGDKIKRLCQKNATEFNDGVKNIETIMKDVNEIKASITRQKANLASLKKYQATQILKANLLKVKK